MKCLIYCKRSEVQSSQFRVSFLLLILATVGISLLNNNIVNADKNEGNDSLEPVVVNASVDRSEISIGDKIRFTITVEYNHDIAISFPEFGENLADFTIKDFGRSEPKKLKSGKIEQKEWYVLDTFLTGSYVIPKLTIRYKNAEEDLSEIETNEIFIEVKSVIDEGVTAEDIREIKDPVNISVNYYIIYLILGGVFGLLVIAAGLIYYFRQRKSTKQEVAPPQPPAHEIAYKELKILIALDLITKGKTREYFYRLSTIVRCYIENRFALMAPERTTEEFLAEMTDREIMEMEHKRLIRKFLEQCDLVKFAKYGPDNEEIDGAYNSAKKLVDETKTVSS
ncbi:MAG: BatD family protein [Candidatus Anammoxibacter sp.]